MINPPSLIAMICVVFSFDRTTMRLVHDVVDARVLSMFLRPSATTKKIRNTVRSSHVGLVADVADYVVAIEGSLGSVLWLQCVDISHLHTMCNHGCFHKSAFKS